jgi:outer membrane receptor protein involved in Fe transport
MTPFKRTLLQLAITATLFPSVGLMAATPDDQTAAPTGVISEITSAVSSEVNALSAQVSAPAAATNAAPAVGDATILAPMEVSATSLGKGSALEKMDVSTTTLTREQIASSPQLNLDQILTQQMGVFINNAQSQTDQTGTGVSMRGSPSGMVLVMVDGVPMNDGMFRTVDWQQIPKSTIDKIEVIRGGGGASMWGNMASGGIINITTKAPEKGNKQLGFAYGNMDTKVGSAAITAYSSDKIQTSFNYDVVETAGWVGLPKQDRVSPNTNVSSAYRAHNGLWSTYFTPNDTSRYFVKIYGTELLQDQLQYAAQNDQLYKLGLRTGGKTGYSKSGSFNFTGFYDYNEMDKANAGLSSGSNGTKPISINYISGAGIAQSVNQPTQIEAINYAQYGMSTFVQDRLDLRKWGAVEDIKVGVDARGVNISDHATVLTQAGSSTSLTPTQANTFNPYLTTDISGQNAFEGIFLQGTYKPALVPGLQATFGVREDLYQAFNPSVQVKKATGSNVQTGGTNLQFNQLDPRFGLKYGFDNGIDLRGAVYRNMTAPGMNQLYRSYGSSSYGGSNSGLTPLSTFGQEIGIDFTGNKVKTSLTGFHNIISNYITSVGVCGKKYGNAADCTTAELATINAAPGYVNASQNQNIGSVTTKGVEAFAEWKALDTLTLNASLAKNFAQVDSFNATMTIANNKALAQPGGVALLSPGMQLAGIPTLMLTQGGTWNIRPDLTMSWAIKAWPAYFSSDTVHTGNSMNQAATTADVHFGYKATKKIDLYINAQNINNAYYLSSGMASTSTVGTIGQPRTILGGFNIKF